MRRRQCWLQTLIIYLLLGLITTVSVAWGLALLPTAPLGDVDETTDDENDLTVARRSGLGSLRVKYMVSYRWVPDTPLYFYLDLVNDQGGHAWWNKPYLHYDISGVGSWGTLHNALEQDRVRDGLDDARGFPALAVWCTWVEGKNLRGGIALPDATQTAGAVVFTTGTRRALPYYPIWQGLLVNTAFYGGLFFILVRAVPLLLYLRRARRGLCPHCGYDRMGDYSLPCPECGQIYTPTCSRSITATASTTSST